MVSKDMVSILPLTCTYYFPKYAHVLSFMWVYLCIFLVHFVTPNNLISTGSLDRTQYSLPSLSHLRVQLSKLHLILGSCISWDMHCDFLCKDLSCTHHMNKLLSLFVSMITFLSSYLNYYPNLLINFSLK